MIKKPGARRPDDEYPTVHQNSYAQTQRLRRSEEKRTSEMMREFASARRAGRFGMDDVLKRLGAWGDKPRPHR